MKKLYSIRKIDNLGRIVIPMDLRKALEIHEWDDLRIALEGNAVTIRKEHDSCTFCGSEKNLTSFENKSVCKSCLAKLKEI
ncbi:MAG: AbrB/MazE/SpoVT family DNA-binding domain-containing protein [Ruminococcaceae bacterium]|nr:AbrB/MazE/SpoVT family DNA-binding domain-containing protein [Oscillospiraceae bacterium]